MSIKAGAILFDANGFVIDRIQSGGPGSLNIPEEKIYEVGNWQSVGTVYDIPDLSFDLESFDASCEFEAILLGEIKGSSGQTNANAFSSTIGTNEIDFQDACPIDVVSPFKSQRNAYNIINGVAVPYLTLERASYRFGVGQNASQQFTLKGDSIYYTPGQPFTETQAVSGTPSNAQVVTFNYGPAAVYTDNGLPTYVLNVTLYNHTAGTYKRLFADSLTAHDQNGFTIAASVCTDYEEIRYVYSAPDDSVDYVQAGHAVAGPFVQNTPTGVGVKPAAIRAKDIDIFVGDDSATTVWTRLTGVQTAEATWSVSLENDQELGNSRYVSQDYDVPEVSGSLTVKAFDTADLFSKISTVTGVSATEVLGPDVTTPVKLEIGINDPSNGNRIKTIYVPEARFKVPGMNARVQTKLESQFDYVSDTGAFKVYNGSMR